VESEDLLLNFICGIDSRDQIDLLRYLRTEYLSCEGIAIFIDHLRDSPIDSLIWDSACRRLRLPVSVRDLENSHAVASRFLGQLRAVGVPMQRARSLDGIISYEDLQRS
jgi:hypothetical protein